MPSLQHPEVFLVEMTARNPHGHSDLEIGVILNGNVTLFADQERVELRMGDIYLVNRYQVHSFAAGKSPVMILAFQIHADLYRDLNYQMTFLRFDEKVIRSGPLHEKRIRYFISGSRLFQQPVFEPNDSENLWMHRKGIPEKSAGTAAGAVTAGV